MGMYTELVLKCTLKQSIDQKDINVLHWLFNDGDKPEILPNHEFFNKPRFDFIGNSSSCYHIPNVLNYFDGFYLFTRTDLKNYDCEIESFIDWLKPLLDVTQGECIGYTWYESDIKPELIIV